MKILIGGQAIISGVMMRTPKTMAMAVRKGARIVIKTRRVKSISEKYPVFKLPVLRGFVTMVETLTTGMEALEFSANQTSEEEPLSKSELAVSMILALGFVVVFFIVLPFIITKLLRFEGFGFNLVDGLLRVLFFAAYLIVLSRFKDVQELYSYHGAEHKAVHAYEAGKNLDVKSVRPFPILHPRCGTSFLMIVMAMSILTFSIVSSKNWIVQIGLRILLIPLIAGLSYEVLKFSAKFERNIIFKILIMPGLAFQRLTTKEPTPKQIEVGIAALKAVLKKEGIKAR